ncbi:NADP-dependent glyceraldehyde-3-phosphate dehydrogenase, partial [Candidatus Dependentiae bacterium]|nr:NADP-dependent glyceraldehyde-3-phosphate dehydrogenase [Candidatus Dependentiae bacterium]
MSNENLKNLFPEENQIPKEFKVKFPLHQTEYLINGELRVWSGPMQDVYSPICLKVSDKVTQEQMGSYPLLTEKEAL